MANVTFKHNPVTLIGNEIKVGDKAPDFTVLANDMSEVSLASSKGKIRLFSVVPSVDTGVCDAQTRKFNEEASKLENVEVITVSVDLPLRKEDGVQQVGWIMLLPYQTIEICLSGKHMV